MFVELVHFLDGALGFFGRDCPNKKHRNKIDSNVGSVSDQQNS